MSTVNAPKPSQQRIHHSTSHWGTTVGSRLDRVRRFLERIPLAGVVLLLYPLLVHTAVLTGWPILHFAALGVLITNLLGTWLWRGNRLAWLGFVLLIALSTGLAVTQTAQFFLYAAPVLAALAMAWFFGRTLLFGRVPLITRFAQMTRGPLPAPVARYTHGATVFWCAAMLCLAFANTLLALLASPVLWSLFTNFIDYLIVAVLFALEWFVRQWLIGHYESLGWFDYLKALRRIDYRRIVHG